MNLSFQPPEEDDPRDDDQRMRGYMGSTPDGGIDDHDEPTLPDGLHKEVDAWFAANTGLGGCSDKDVAALSEIFYSVTHEGGRESVDDALAVVDSFGPGIAGLNDTYARQVLLAQEVRRLHADYIKAVQGRQEWRYAAIRARMGGVEADLRKALRIARDHIDMGALRVSHCKDAEVIEKALTSSPHGGPAA